MSEIDGTHEFSKSNPELSARDLTIIDGRQLWLHVGYLFAASAFIDRHWLSAG